VKDLLRVADLSAGDLALLLKLATGFQDEPAAERGLLTGRIVPMYFAKPSTRTHLSTAAAVTRLGGTPVALGPDELQLQLRRGETIADTANVARSLMEAAALAGMDMAIASPDGYLPREEAVASAGAEAGRHGGSIMVTQDPAAAVGGASVVYTDVWLSMGDSEDERGHRRDVFAAYQVNQDLMDRAAEDAVFMHCLPAHRGEEVTGGVIDGGRSLAFRQAANRLPAAQAVLCALLGDQLEGNR
jgi:ornithine carbamoyltransferase